jgi:3-hydroxyisobutyrate dehydrogenase
MRVAVLGTGTMGAGMARSMLRAGLDVAAWNRTADRAEPLKAAGATIAGTVREAVDGADAVVTMMFDAPAVLGVADDLIAALAADAVWVQSATIGLNGVARVGRLAGERGVTLLDAPMLGTKQPADEGALVPLVAGPRDAARRVQPVFEAIGAKTIYAGDRIGQAMALKLACNAWIATVTAALGQSLELAAALGIEPSPEMLDSRYPPSFSVDGVLKDLGLMADAAGAAGFPRSLLTPVREAYARASAAGHGSDDIAAVHTEFRPALSSSDDDGN